jgi:HD-GYP domain-containing protein (c-di-GMP phosphodiesterase class II)
VQAARDEIAAWSGRQFDPLIVGIFLSISSTVWEDLHRRIDSQTERFSFIEQLSKEPG